MRMMFRLTIGSLLLLILLIGCQNKTKVKDDNIALQESVSPFNNVLKKKLEYFISTITERGSRIPVYCIDAYKENDSCIIRIRTDYFYDKAQIVGYTLLNKQLIALYESEPSCIHDFIDTKQLITFKDTIPGFSEIDSNFDLKYNSQKILLKIIAKDSLRVLYIGD